MAGLKGDWQALVGKTIQEIVICCQGTTPKSQIHLVFSDGSTFQIYSGEGEYIAGNRRLYRGNLTEVLSHHKGSEIVVYKKSGGG